MISETYHKHPSNVNGMKQADKIKCINCKKESIDKYWLCVRYRRMGYEVTCRR